MKISLVTDTYLPEINGVTTVLARMRRGLRDRGHQVQVIAPRYPQPGPDDDGVLRRASIPCPGYAAVRLSWPWSARAPAALDAHRPDLVHVVLHVGRLAVEKDVATMATAFRLLHARFGRRLAFWVAGDGPKAGEVRAGLPFAAHAGFLARESLAELYADADLFVFPSPTETCGLVALEAMSAGLPVVAADQGGVGENVRSGINGLLARAGDPAAFADAAAGLVADPGHRLAMARAARALPVARDWERELDALGPLYDSARCLVPSAKGVPSAECPVGA